MKPTIAAILIFATAALAGTASGRGIVYTADERGNSVTAITLESGKVTTVRVPITPHNVQISGDGQRILAVGMGVEAHGKGHGAATSGRLVILDARDVVAAPLQIDVGRHPAHVVVDRAGRFAYVTDGVDNAVNDSAFGTTGWGNTTTDPNLPLTTTQGILKLNEDTTTVTLAVNIDLPKTNAVGQTVSNVNFGFAPPLRLTKVVNGNADLNLADCYLALGRLDPAQWHLERVPLQADRRPVWGGCVTRYGQHEQATLGEESQISLTVSGGMVIAA